MKKIKNPNVAIELTKEEALKLGINPTVNNQSGEMKTTGPYQICKSFKALCLSKTYDKSKMYTEVKEVVLYGLRTMSNPKQGGYELEGYVSIKGKKYSWKKNAAIRPKETVSGSSIFPEEKNKYDTFRSFSYNHSMFGVL